MEIQTIITWVISGVVLILTFIFGKRIGTGNVNRRTVDRIDDTLTSAGDTVGDVIEGVDSSVQRLEDIDGEITSLSDSISEDKQRLTNSIERLQQLQVDARVGTERHKRITDIIEELQKRYDNSSN